MLMVQNGLIKVKNKTNYNNGQNNTKQSWENILIFKYIRIFWTHIFNRTNNCCFCSRANSFGYSIVIFFCCQIYLDIHLSNIYSGKCIQICSRKTKLYLSHTDWWQCWLYSDCYVAVLTVLWLVCGCVDCTLIGVCQRWLYSGWCVAVLTVRWLGFASVDCTLIGVWRFWLFFD